MKVGIVTLIGKTNYGNRLQNYAVQRIINQKTVITIDNDATRRARVLINIKMFFNCIKSKNERRRYKNFVLFDKKINFSKRTYFGNFCLNSFKEYDYLIVGSDQIWNPKFGRLNKLDLLKNVPLNKRIALSASFGIDNIPNNKKEKVGKELKKFKAISVREDRGKEIVEELTGRKDIEVLIDPTMLLTSNEWDEISIKPKMLNTKKYILNYFLGDLSDERKREIDRVAKKNNCEVINLLDKNSPYYECGPSEFLYLEKHAFLICTDSFHSCVFAILYNRPFIIFEREDNSVSMNSRLDTLISKFNLKNRYFTGKITNDNLRHDYKEAFNILKEERIKVEIFIKKALDVKEKRVY